MIDSIIKVTGSILANDTTQNSLAQIDIPENALIMALSSSLVVTQEAEGPNTPAEQTMIVSAELSFLSTNQFNSNDARGCIEELHVSYVMHNETDAAIAMSPSVANKCCVFPSGIPVMAGERLHAHGSSNTALLLANFTFLLYLDNKGGGRRSPRRR